MALACLVAACACQDTPEPPWVLTQPRMLAIRTTVVVQGPNSEDLIPVPADRMRSEPLPGDTLQLEVLIADATGVRDPEDFEVRWFLCPLVGICLSRLRETGGPQPCTDAFPEESICELGTGNPLQHVVPPLDPDVLIPLQGQRRLAAIAGVPGVRDTNTCVRKLGERPYESFDGCLMAMRTYDLGPLIRVYELGAAATGQPLPEGVQDMEPVAVQAAFAPEVVRLEFRESTTQDEIRALPGDVTTVPPDARLGLSGYGDPRDGGGSFPRGIDFADAGVSYWSFPTLPRMYVTRPDLIGPGAFGLSTGDDGDTFQLIVTITNPSGAQSWATFDFVVTAP